MRGYDHDAKVSHSLETIASSLAWPFRRSGQNVYAEYKRFKDVCWILRDGAQHEINADLEAGSSALHIEQCFLGQMVEEG